jgi:hypothetical protein
LIRRSASIVEALRGGDELLLRPGECRLLSSGRLADVDAARWLKGTSAIRPRRIGSDVYRLSFRGRLFDGG